MQEVDSAEFAGAGLGRPGVQGVEHAASLSARSALSSAPSSIVVALVMVEFLIVVGSALLQRERRCCTSRRAVSFAVNVVTAKFRGVSR
ncbi:hypothetical protein ABGB08_44000 [Acrocarpospora sp. B8E8]